MPCAKALGMIHCTCTLRIWCLNTAGRTGLNANLIQLTEQETQLPLHFITATNIVSELTLECTHIWVQLCIIYWGNGPKVIGIYMYMYM